MNESQEEPLKIEELIRAVCNENLLIRRDVPPEKVGEIHLTDATRASLRSTSGEVLAVGPGVKIDVQPGDRILFAEFSGTIVSLEGIQADSNIIFLPDIDVLAILSPAAVPRPADELGLPLAWMGEAQARAGYLLVERAETALTRGLIELPPSARLHTRSTEAVVVSVGPGVHGFEVGDILQLASLGGRKIGYGCRGERELWQISPRSVLGKYGKRPPATVLSKPAGFTMPGEILEAVFSNDGKMPEGDLRGLR